MAGAVKVTVDPRQNGFDEALTVTPTGNIRFTVMVTGVEVAGLFKVQFTIDEVKMTVIRSPLLGKYVKTGEPDNWLIPFNFHWYCGDVPPFTGTAVQVTG